MCSKPISRDYTEKISWSYTKASGKLGQRINRIGGKASDPQLEILLSLLMNFFL